MAKKTTSGLYVNRWQRHGKDILYVNDAAGEKVGRKDLQTRKIYVEKHMKHRRRDFELALNEWRRGESRAHPAPVIRSSGQPSRDLAGQRAGDGLLAVAQQRQIQNRGLRLLLRVFGVRTADRAWRVGAKGEKRVGNKLDKLERAGWHVLHNVELPGGGDVDHLVIGPGGVWTINSKNHRNATIKMRRGQVVVNNAPWDYPEAARLEATRVAEVLRPVVGWPINVTPMIVIYGAARIHGWVLRRPLGVAVVPSWAARWWFRLPGRAVLSAEDVEAVYAVARLSGTWQRA